MFDAAILAIVAATFLVAGTVKGVIGLGLPTVSLAVLTVAIGLTEAMALLLVPSFVTNLWQAAIGGAARTIVKRTWPFLIVATVTVWFGAGALTRVDLSLLSALLGVVLAVYAAVGLSGWQFSLTPQQARWAGPAAGAANGILTGMTGSFVVPGVMYLQAIGLPRDALIQAMGILFTVSTVALAGALGGNSLLNTELGIVSSAAVLPALIGMVAGQRLRRAMPESIFRRVFFAALLALGTYIIATAM